MFEAELFYNLLTALVGFLYIGAVVTTIAVVILDNRNPVKTLSWVLILAFLPLVGLVLYYFFGQDTRKEKLIEKKGYVHLLKHPMREFQQQQAFTKQDDSQPVMRFFQNVNQSLPFAGNNVNVYTHGSDMLCDLLKAIARAKHHIHLEFYIIEDDSVGRLVRDALIDKAKQGVEVRFLYDDVGSWAIPVVFVESFLNVGI